MPQQRVRLRTACTTAGSGGDHRVNLVDGIVDRTAATLARREIHVFYPRRKLWPRSRLHRTPTLFWNFTICAARRKCVRPATGGSRNFSRRTPRIYESRICPGLPGKQLVAPGGWLLGNGRIIGAPRRIERRLVPATRVQRRDVCHFREGPSLPERAAREDRRSRDV